ncbi:hypothetical protein [Nonomuraea sp. NPDC050783]
MALTSFETPMSFAIGFPTTFLARHRPRQLGMPRRYADHPAR